MAPFEDNVALAHSCQITTYILDSYLLSGQDIVKVYYLSCISMLYAACPDIE